jgi:hypothetical protein
VEGSNRSTNAVWAYSEAIVAAISPILGGPSLTYPGDMKVVGATTIATAKEYRCCFRVDLSLKGAKEDPSRASFLQKNLGG